MLNHVNKLSPIETAHRITGHNRAIRLITYKNQHCQALHWQEFQLFKTKALYKLQNST